MSGPTRLRLLVDDEEILAGDAVLSLTVAHELGRIPRATLRLADGEPARQTFPLSDTDQLVPGRRLEIRLGTDEGEWSVFRGPVIGQRIRVRRQSNSLTVECRDEAVRMTRGRRSRCFGDSTDAAALEELVEAHGLVAQVAPTGAEHPMLVQHDATDWDFLLSRAEANGHVVAVRDGIVTVGPPRLDVDPVTTADFGEDLLELDAELDASVQVSGITAAAWDAADQQVLQVDAAEPRLDPPGNLAPADLAEVLGTAPVALRHGGRLSAQELQAWADGRLLRERLAQVRGRVRVRGVGGITAGDVIEVTGIGRRFAGRHYVSAVRHTMTDGAWETDLVIGLPAAAGTGTGCGGAPVSAAPAGGLLPSVPALQSGVVTDLDGDPAGQERIRVRLPLADDTAEGTWARLATLDAGEGRGTCFRPEIGDEVVVGFLAADPRHPVVLGQVHSSAHPAPFPATEDNQVKGYRSREGLELRFDDGTGEISLATPGGNRLTLSEDETAVTLADQHGSTVVLDGNGITLSSTSDLTLEAAGSVTVSAMDISLAAQGRFVAEGMAGADVTATGALTLAGSLIRLN
ncbi:type VI secretion system tip protein VgrG [Brachybacterium vulturis]|uniref:type VI secretion system tip protein VgrG n=1 Tax=Brachybacterium vulturis TaxID=2017484 RepID=UPI003736E95F